MSFTITVTEQSAVEPVTLDEARAQLRLDADQVEENALILKYIITARRWVENYINRKLITQTLTYRSNKLTESIELSPNLQSITSIKYIDNDGVQQTINANDYQYNQYELVGCVMPGYQKSWPAVRDNLNSVEIEFIAGYGLAADVPQDIKDAILIMIHDSFENRGETYVGVSVDKLDTVNNLLMKYRVRNK